MVPTSRSLLPLIRQISESLTKIFKEIVQFPLIGRILSTRLTQYLLLSLEISLAARMWLTFFSSRK